MASTMPSFPRVYFRYVEPFMIAFGSLDLLLHGATGASTYLSVPPHPALQSEHFLALQAASMMMLSGVLLSVIMWTVREPRTIWLTVLALALSDIPHWAAAAWCLGPLAWDPLNWSLEMKAYMGVPVITFAIKIAYLLGWFGYDSGVEEKGAKNQ